MQQFLERKGNPRYELVGDVNLRNRKNIFNLGNLVRVDGDLDLFKSSIQSLESLEYVAKSLNLTYTPIQSLGNLKYVGGYLDLIGSSIQSLGNLEYVGGTLHLHDTPIQSLGALEYVGGYLRLDGTSIKSLGNLNNVRHRIVLSSDHQIPEEQLTKFEIEY